MEEEFYLEYLNLIKNNRGYAEPEWNWRAVAVLHLLLQYPTKRNLRRGLKTLLANSHEKEVYYLTA